MCPPGPLSHCASGRHGPPTHASAPIPWAQEGYSEQELYRLKGEALARRTRQKRKDAAGCCGIISPVCCVEDCSGCGSCLKIERDDSCGWCMVKTVGVSAVYAAVVAASAALLMCFLVCAGAAGASSN